MPVRLLASHPGFAWEIEWSLTWACNATCFFCSTGHYDRGDYAQDALPICDRIIEARPFMVTLSGGEATVHPQFSKIAEHLINARISVNLTTNGLNLHKIPTEILARFNWIRVSLHATDSTVASKIMGTSFNINRVLSNIRALRDSTQRFSIFVLLTPRNLEPSTLRSLVEQAAISGAARIEIGLMKRLGWASKEEIPTREQIAEAVLYMQDSARHFSLELVPPQIEAEDHYCMARRLNAAVLPDGSVASCSFDGQHWGNLYGKSFSEIWADKIQLDDYCDKCAPGGYFNDSYSSKRRVIPLTRS